MSDVVTPGNRHPNRSALLAAGVAVLPAVAACAVWTLWRTGRLGGGGEFVEVRLGAQVQDWVLTLGVLVSVVLAVVLALVAHVRRVRARAEREARSAVTARAVRDRQLLLGRLDHELKNPLTAIRLALANAAADEASPEQRTRGLRSIEEQVLRLSRLTADLRKIADVQTSPVTFRRVDLTALLEEALEVVGEQPRAAGRRLDLDVPRAPWPLPAVDGDADLLALALVNLVDNAVKYTPEGGNVEVRAREDTGGVLVEVADTGQGIPAEDLPHVWDELFRSPAARTVAGSGLGLPLVRAVVERHGGTVSADSREGQGTVVRVHLPAAPPE
ncbi:HAMP domain-containing sensor histidine kinase [Kineococcus sp. NPDC059986]|uniref:sensor histidine kinase n=1 Tax=Kineococcus sp. NPDC059986 TaxID=3155538 RepID=UPI00344C8368